MGRFIMLEDLVNFYQTSVFNSSRVDRLSVKIEEKEYGNFSDVKITITNMEANYLARMKLVEQFNSAYVEVVEHPRMFWSPATSLILTDLLALELDCPVRLIEDDRLVYSSQLENLPNFNHDKVEDFIFKVQTSTLFDTGSFEVVQCQSVNHMIYLTVYKNQDYSNSELFVINSLSGVITPIKNWDLRIVKILKIIFRNDEKLEVVTNV